MSKKKKMNYIKKKKKKNFKNSFFKTKENIYI
jgi:hypothetical protein